MQSTNSFRPFSILLLVVCLGWTTPVWPGSSTVEIWEEPLVLPTYKIAKPDPNPRFYDGATTQGAQKRVYPYAMSDVLTDEREDKTYKAIFLENEYIKLCVLPELGGRIFSASDKTNNYDFFYRQHVIKPALIGMLGAWISGGVEWNFPHHHRATTLFPMDYVIQKSSDGSATLWIGETERRHGMRFVLAITLYPRKSFIEVTVRPYNRTSLPHSFLYWANPAVHVDSTYQVIFPPNVQYVTQHAKREFSDWPISNSRYGGWRYDHVDISWWKNLPQPVSFFAWNYREDYFAGYNHGKEAGVAYVANHHIAPGMKFFTFGCGNAGATWDRMLTDADGPYLELMAGAYSDNQPDYSWLQPFESKLVRQYWFPIRELGGLTYANLNGALNLELTEKGLAKIRLNATSRIPDAKVLLKAKGKVIGESKIEIGPDRPYAEEVRVPPGTKETDLCFSLHSADGQALLSYQPATKTDLAMPEPVRPPADPKNIETVEELYLSGLRLNQFYNAKIDPYPYYEEALRRDPGNYRVNTQLGILYCKRKMWSQATEKLQTALKRITHNHTSPKDGEAFYYLGVALRSQGKTDEAYDAFYRATWSLAWHAAAYYALAELDCRRQDFRKALEHLERSISTNSANLRALTLRCVVLRKLGRLESAEQHALDLADRNPLDYQSRNELSLLRSLRGLNDQGQRALDDLKKLMRDEAESYLNLAVGYGNCGFWDEAIDVLSRLDGTQNKSGTRHPMLYYYLGYYWAKKGRQDEAARYYRLASEMDPTYCFPFRSESIDVLRHAERTHPADARAPYYLGNLLFDHQPEEAVKEWEKALRLDNTDWRVHRNLALAYRKRENDLPKAVESMETAVAINPGEPRMYYELDLLYEQSKVPLDKRLRLFQENRDVVAKRNDALLRSILVHVQAGKYDDAIDTLTSHHFHRWEGGTDVRALYVDACLLRGNLHFDAERYNEALRDYLAAFEYPETLDMGRPPHSPRFAQIFYYAGTAYEALRESEKAREYFGKCVAENAGRSEYLYCQGLAYRKLDDSDNAERMFARLLAVAREQSKPGDFFAKFGERQSRERQLARAHYLTGLAYLGKGDASQLGAARVEFEKALELNPDHIWARFFLKDLPQDWTRAGPLGPKPERVTDALPLSDQTNTGDWKKHPAMTDEFEETELDSRKWWPINPSWKGRKPGLFYARNVNVSDGKLHLTMKKETVPEMATLDGFHTYTCAAVQSKSTVKYGYFEVKARAMKSAGSSSFWFYATSEKWHTEIDVYEIGGAAPGFEKKYNMNVHVFRTPTEKRHWSRHANWIAPADLADAYHVYGLEWNQHELKWYVDGVLVRWLKNTHWHQPLTLNFDSETMPGWFGLPEDKDLPSVFSIEYVRAWKQNE